MAFITDDTEDQTLTEQEDTSVIHPDLETVISSTKDIAPANVIGWMNGTPISVNYYHGLQPEDGQVETLALEIPAVNQSYQLIEDMELVLESGIESTYDADSQKNLYTATALVNAAVTPNMYDMVSFVYIDGRELLMEISNVERLSHLATTAHRVELRELSIGDSELLVNAKAKASLKTTYIKDQIQVGGKAIIGSETMTRRMDLKDMLIKLSTMHRQSFYSSQMDSLVLESPSGYKLYDRYMNDLVRTIMPDISRVRVLEDPYESDRANLWDALLKMKSYLLGSGDTYSGWIPVNYLPPLGTNPRLVNGESVLVTHLHSEESCETHGYTVLTEEFTETVEGIHDPMSGSSYILSDDWYDGVTETDDLMEQLINQHMLTQNLNRDVLDTLCESSFGWPDHYRYWYQPILMILITMELRK